MLNVAKLMMPKTHLKSFLGSTFISTSHALAHVANATPEAMAKAGVTEAGIVVFGTSYIVLTVMQT